MNYRPSFLFAVLAVHEKYGEEEGRALFELIKKWSAPFDASVSNSDEFVIAPPAPQTSGYLKVGSWTVPRPSVVEFVYKNGVPFDNKVSWIKKFREAFGCGLLEAKRICDYVALFGNNWIDQKDDVNVALGIPGYN